MYKRLERNINSNNIARSASLKLPLQHEDEAKRPSALEVASYVVPFTFVFFIRFSGNVSFCVFFLRNRKHKKGNTFSEFRMEMAPVIGTTYDAPKKNREGVDVV